MHRRFAHQQSRAQKSATFNDKSPIQGARQWNYDGKVARTSIMIAVAFWELPLRRL